jgi:hypothetical protein
MKSLIAKFNPSVATSWLSVLCVALHGLAMTALGLEISDAGLVKAQLAAVSNGSLASAQSDLAGPLFMTTVVSFGQIAVLVAVALAVVVTFSRRSSGWATAMTVLFATAVSCGLVEKLAYWKWNFDFPDDERIGAVAAQLRERFGTEITDWAMPSHAGSAQPAIALLMALTMMTFALVASRRIAPRSSEA